MAKEIEHLHIDNDAIGRRQKILDPLSRHRQGDIQEETQQQILQAEQRDIQPAR